MNYLDPRLVSGFNRRAPFSLGEATTVVIARRGSHTYGTQTPESDQDYIGVVVPPIGFKLGFLNPTHMARWEGVQYIEDGIDCTWYTLDKFASLCAKCSPNALELLWLRPEFILTSGPEWEVLWSTRNAFSSRAAYKTFVGMAQSKSNTSAVHPVRLLRMLVEFLDTGVLRVWRDRDADELRAIKAGSWDMPGTDIPVIEGVEALIKRASMALVNCTLPERANVEAINAMLLLIHLSCYTRSRP